MRTGRCPVGLNVEMKRLVLLAIVVLGACSSDASRVADDPTSKPSGNYRNQRVEWFLRSISDDGRTLRFTYQMSGVASRCEKEGTPSVGQSSDRVVVMANKWVTRDRDRACTEELAYVKAKVLLDEPLGDRALVGCRPRKDERSEDKVCRDLKRSQDAGVFEGDASPPPAVPGY